MAIGHRRRQALGAIQVVLGRAMNLFGRLFGSRPLEAEGRAEELRGRVNMKGGQVAGEVEGEAHDVARRAAGRVSRLWPFRRRPTAG